jgi:prepilin-type N-terminal cleavage/methylation domain-containing protein
MDKQKGFTIIELVAVILMLSVIGFVGWTQISHIETANRDDKRRTAINALYYSLEEVYYSAHKSYPKTIDEKILPSVDKDLFNDPSGAKLGEGSSDYRYEPTNCTDTECKSYTLRADLEAESDYVKESRNK